MTTITLGDVTLTRVLYLEAAIDQYNAVELDVDAIEQRLGENK